MDALANLGKPFVFDGKYLIPQEMVDDIICRYLLNIPKEEKFDPIRVCFQIELAHWFFLDYYCGEGCAPSLAHLHNMPYNQFAYIMFQETPHLRPRLPEIETHLAAFREYKMRVPTFGAILMNQALTKAVLVQGFRNNWGFPKGKVNEMEDPVACAIREVFEETGYDIAPLVNPNHYIESKVHERNDRLYLVRGVDMKFPFQPQTLFEIKNIQWFTINELPEHKKDTNPLIAKHGIPINNFYSVYSYVRRLKLWINDKLEGRNKLQHFKVRPDADSENQTPSSSSIQKSKSSDHVQKKGKTLVPFFEQQPPHGDNISILGGWKIFPQPNANTNQPYMLNSNAIQELILSSPRQQQQQGQGQGVIAANSKAGGGKGARRRLFSSDESQLAAKQQHSKTQQNKSGLTQGQTPSSPKASNAAPQTQAKAKGSKSGPAGAGVGVSGHLVRYPRLYAQSWINFTFDRERVYKAFFTPPPTIK